MDKENFDAIIARYLDKFDLMNKKPHAEYFKWQSVAYFQKYWNLDASNMLEMFTSATKGFSILFDGSNNAPTSGIKELLKNPKEVDFVRSAFKSLLADDKGDLQLREEKLWHFIDTINERIDQYWPESHLFRQSMRSAIGCLAMARPAENYIYFYSKAENWANCVEFGEDIGSGSNFSLSTYYRMCDELVQCIKGNPRIQKCGQLRMDAAIADNKSSNLVPTDFDFDDNYHLLAYDIIYCATTYNLYIDIPHYSKGIAKRIQRSHDRNELELIRADYLSALMKYEEIYAVSSLPLNMVGLKVFHKLFGEGIIISHKDSKQEVGFSGVVKAFIFPDAYIKHFLTPAEDAAIIIKNQIQNCSALATALKDLKEKQSLYEKKKEVFNKIWSKTTQAVEEDEDE